MLDLRNHFFLPETPTDAIELRAFTHGLMPKTVPAMMQHFADDWREHGVDAWNAVPNHWQPGSGESVGWWTLPAYLGDHFIAPLLGAAPGTCIHQPNVNWTANALFSAPEPFESGRNEVVLTGAEFPSFEHTARRWAKRLGLRLHTVPLGEEGFVDRAAVEAALGPRTAMLVLSHVGFATGEKLEDDWLRALADRVHRHGGLFVLDGYHATGSIDLEVQTLEVDVYTGGLLKEACGSSGNAFVYLRPGLSLTPLTTGWFGDAAPFAFASAPEAHPEVRQRFLGGTSAIAAMYHAVEGVRVLLDAGLAGVRADSLAKTARCIEHAHRLGLALCSPEAPDRRGAMVILEAPHADRLCAFLKTRGVFTDSRRGTRLRLAPFVWNTLDDVDRAFALIAEALATGAYTDTPLKQGGPVT